MTNLMVRTKPLDCYSEAIKCEPSNAKHYFNRARTLDKLREYTKALSDVNQVLKLEPYSRNAQKFKIELNEKLNR
jgi:tetratricopeptide (TPR) repeat protein